jgi:hypothetical protein
MFGSRKAKKEIKKLLKNRPKYEIPDEAAQNQAAARAQAYGRDRSIQMQEENIGQEAANAASAAKDVSGSTSALLSTIAAINANKTGQLRGLAQDEAAMQAGKMQNMYAANTAMVDEKDKAWNYNVNMPYQQKLQRANEKLRRAQMITDSFSGVAIAVGGSAATQGTSDQGGSGNGEGGSGGGLFGMLGSVISDERVKEDIKPTTYGLPHVMKMNVVEYKYIKSDVNHVGLIAQEADKIVPESVSEVEILTNQGPQKIMSINYNEIVPVLIKAIQDQQAIMNMMQEEITALKNK